MIKASRSRYGVWFDLDHGASANVEVHHYGIKLRISDDNYAAEVSHADAASLLRAMLREIAGPSIDDVREAWGAKTGHVYARHPSTRDGLYDVQVWDGDRDRSFMSQTLREALQEAYDAGVARRGGADA